MSSIFGAPVTITKDNFREHSLNDNLKGSLAFLVSNISRADLSTTAGWIKSVQKWIGGVSDENARTSQALVLLGIDRNVMQAAEAVISGVDLHENRIEDNLGDNVRLVAFPITNHRLRANLKLAAVRLAENNPKGYDFGVLIGSTFLPAYIQHLSDLKQDICTDTCIVLEKGDDFKADICSTFATRALSTAAFLSTFEDNEIMFIKDLDPEKAQAYLERRYDDLMKREDSIFHRAMAQLNQTTQGAIPGRMHQYLAAAVNY